MPGGIGGQGCSLAPFEELSPKRILPEAVQTIMEVAGFPLPTHSGTRRRQNRLSKDDKEYPISKTSGVCAESAGRDKWVVRIKERPLRGKTIR